MSGPLHLASRAWERHHQAWVYVGLGFVFANIAYRGGMGGCLLLPMTLPRTQTLSVETQDVGRAKGKTLYVVL